MVWFRNIFTLSVTMFVIGQYEFYELKVDFWNGLFLLSIKKKINKLNLFKYFIFNFT